MNAQQGMEADVPEAVRDLLVEPELAAAWEQQVAARQAEAAKITALLDYQDRLVAYYCEDPSTLRYQAEKAALRDAARIMGVSEFTTGITLGAVRFARDYLPATWKAFTGGGIDVLRVRKIADAASEVEDHLVSRIDDAAAGKAATGRSIGEFQRWLTGFVAQADYEAYGRLCAAKRKDRYVRFFHAPDGMSHIDARLPTIEAAAIQKRLTITARRQHSAPPVGPILTDDAAAGHSADTAGEANNHDDASLGGPEADEPADDRTLTQREADLFSAWLRTGDTPEEGTSPVEAKIMIMIPEATLTGASQEPATAADRSWRLPAGQARALAAHPDAAHEWYQGHTARNVQEADVDVLSVTYAGRYPPARLREALAFRDGVCQAKGCSVPAERCDLDHQLPWDAGGETSAANLWALCRRHHQLKSHGFLQPPAHKPRAHPLQAPGGKPAAPKKDEPTGSVSAASALSRMDFVWAFHAYTLIA